MADLGGANRRVYPSSSKKIRTTRAKRLRRSAFIVGFLVLVILLGALGSFVYGQYLFSKVKKVSVSSEHVQVAGQPLNILLIGNNTRTGLSPSEVAAFGSSSQVGGGRADVTMIAHFDPKTKNVTLVSIPRDLFMPIPGTKKLQRVDAALNPTKATGTAENPNQLVKTIEYDLGIPIQHYVELNFDSFQGIVNALGGIKMYFPMPVKDAYSGLNITKPGCITLNGFQALEVVRARHLQYQLPNGTWGYDGLGDLSRTRRDHIFLQVLASQVKASGITNPVKDLSLLKNVLPYLTIDSQFTESEMLSLILTYRHANPAATPTGTLPVAFGPASGYVFDGTNYASIVLPQEPADTTMLKNLIGLAQPKITLSTVNVTVVNGSHSAGVGSTISSGLAGLGFNVSKARAIPPNANPVESVIYYTPGNLAKAEALKATLTGEVIMGQVPSTGYSTPLELLAGDQIAVAVAPVTPSSTKNQPSSSTTATSSTSASSPSTTIASITGATQVNVSQKPQPWDPRACPA
ncbi:LCP family protein [Acidithrix ferrooxidans]|uniref:Putative transcriptional regulator YvhJ n=1 Tax=Acidithrix ferrooxidans TaxID=1280514 RepID=A0A0D8HJT6_9ACTN|nr:LCP family protein [Acidithrix ferrooxidans]KJF18218.1 putative transcriptional regulator YvhJ [Acidithrix ferrooxidans]